MISKTADHKTSAKPIKSCMSGEPTDNQTLENPGLQSKELILEPSDNQTLEKPMQTCMSVEPTVPTNLYVRKNELILQPSDRKNIKRRMQVCMNNRFMTKDFDFIWNPDEFYKNNESIQSKKAFKRFKPTNLISNQGSENQEISQTKVEIKSPQSKRSKTVLDSHEINEKQLEKPVKEKKKKSKAEMASEKFDERFKKAFENQKSEKECLKDSTKKQKQETKVKLQSLKMTSNTVPLSTLMQKRPKKQNVRCS